MAPMNNSMHAALGISRTGDLRTGRTYSRYGQPPCAPCDAARRRQMDRSMSGFGRFSGFGEVKENAAAPLTDFYGRTGDPWDIWMNEAARTWARVTGNVAEAITYRNRGVQLNNAFGTKGPFSSCSTAFTPLPNNTTDCNDIPLAGLSCRGLPVNFHPCESVVKSGMAGALATGAKQVQETATQAQEAWNTANPNQPAAGSTGNMTTTIRAADLMTVANMGISGAMRDTLRTAAAGKLSTMEAIFGKTTEDTLSVVEPKPASNTALLVGGGIAAAVVFFLLRK